MSRLTVSKRKADAISNGALLISIGFLFYTGWWWPGILLALWLALGLRQYLTARYYDFMVSTVLLIGLFIASWIHWRWDILMPILFGIGGIYIIFREYFFGEDANGEEKSDEIKEDIDD